MKDVPGYLLTILFFILGISVFPAVAGEAENCEQSEYSITVIWQKKNVEGEILIRNGIIRDLEILNGKGKVDSNRFRIKSN